MNDHCCSGIFFDYRDVVSVKSHFPTGEEVCFSKGMAVNCYGCHGGTEDGELDLLHC